MLILDENAFYILTKFIQFIREHKIVYLYLPAYSTYSL